MHWLVLTLSLAFGANPVPDTSPRDANVTQPVVAPGARREGVAEVSAPETSTNQIKRAVNDYIKANKSKGVVNLRVLDNGTSKTMKLKFDKIHDPVSKVSDTSYFACTDFQTAEKDPVSGKRVTYDIDFWLTPGPNGRLAVQPERTEIHKVDGKKRFDYKPDGTKIPLAE